MVVAGPATLSAINTIPLIQLDFLGICMLASNLSSGNCPGRSAWNVRKNCSTAFKGIPMTRHCTFSAFVLMLASAIPGPGFADGQPFAEDADPHERVYTLSNAAEGNQVLAFRRIGAGGFTAAGQFATGGTGTGGGLGNQGALALSRNERHLFAVNPGSNDVSVFRVDGNGLELLDRAGEEGVTPVSVAVNRNRVYEVNSGDDSIYGFRFDPAVGKLHPLPGSHWKLSGDGTGAAQISFDPEGDALVVTEKASNKITTFSLNGDGLPIASHSIDSAGTTPFGFAFGKRDRFFVSNAEGAEPERGTVSSYELEADGSVTLIDAEVASGQTAACWLATTPDGRLAFTADTPSNAISSFAIDRDGHLTLRHSKAAEENLPLDLAVSPDGTLLYSLNGGDNTIGVHRILPGGALQKRATIDGLPAGTTGLVVR